MRRGAHSYFVRFVPLASAAIVAAVSVLPTACDSTLNLGDGVVDGSAAGADAGVYPATCAGACDKIFACGLAAESMRASCIPDCVRNAPQSLLGCIAVTPCEKIPSTCSNGFDASLPDVVTPPFDSGQEEFEIMNCQSACDSVHFFNCLDAAETANCRDLCASAPKSKRNSFYMCGEGAGSDCPNARDCYAVFVGD